MSTASQPTADAVWSDAAGEAWHAIAEHLYRTPTWRARQHAQRWYALPGPTHRDAPGLMIEVLAARHPYGPVDVDDAVRQLGGATLLAAEGLTGSAATAATAVRSTLAGHPSQAPTSGSTSGTRTGARDGTTADHRIVDHAAARWAIHTAWQRFGDALYTRRLDADGRMCDAWWHATGSSVSDSAAGLMAHVAQHAYPAPLRRAAGRLAAAVQHTLVDGAQGPLQAVRWAVESWTASEYYLRQHPGPTPVHGDTSALTTTSVGTDTEHDLSPPADPPLDLA